MFVFVASYFDMVKSLAPFFTFPAAVVEWRTPTGKSPVRVPFFFKHLDNAMAFQSHSSEIHHSWNRSIRSFLRQKTSADFFLLFGVFRQSFGGSYRWHVWLLQGSTEMIFSQVNQNPKPTKPWWNDFLFPNKSYLRFWCPRLSSWSLRYSFYYFSGLAVTI